MMLIILMLLLNILMICRDIRVSVVKENQNYFRSRMVEACACNGHTSPENLDPGRCGRLRLITVKSIDKEPVRRKSVFMVDAIPLEKIKRAKISSIVKAFNGILLVVSESFSAILKVIYSKGDKYDENN